MAGEHKADQPDDTGALVVRARTDREALGQLYDLYYDRIFGYCACRLPERSAAEDVCSDVFWQMAAKMRRFRGTSEAEFRTWIYRIATRAIHAYLRRRNQRDVLLRRHAQLRTNSPVDGVGSGYLEPLDWPILHACVAQLGDRDQALITLRYFADMSYEEIAAVMQLRPGTVRTALSRAVSKLRERLSARLPRPTVSEE